MLSPRYDDGLEPAGELATGKNRFTAPAAKPPSADRSGPSRALLIEAQRLDSSAPRGALLQLAAGCPPRSIYSDAIFGHVPLCALLKAGDGHGPVPGERAVPCRQWQR